MGRALIRCKDRPRTPFWKVAYASALGRGHAASGLPCQDAAAHVRSDGALAVVVCDGAGSASRSEFGAQAVAKAVAATLCRHATTFAGDTLNAANLIDVARTAIEGLVGERGGTAADYACTLLGAVVTRTTLATVHLGDGSIVAITKEGADVISEPENGEFANETVFVTSPKAVEHTRVDVRDFPRSLTDLALMTDGAQSSLIEKRTSRVSPVITEIAHWLNEASEDEVSSAIGQNLREAIVPRTSDDCTLAVLHRPPESGAIACPTCGQWRPRRARQPDGSFAIVCVACRTVILAPRSRGRRPGILARLLHPLRWRGVPLRGGHGSEGDSRREAESGGTAAPPRSGKGEHA